MSGQTSGRRTARTVARGILWVLAPLLVLVIASCDRKSAVRHQEPTGRFEIALPLPKAVAARVAWVEYSVTIGDQDTLQGYLRIGDDLVARGTISDVPAGGTRLVRLSAYDAAGVMTYTGAGTAEVVPGETARVRIVMWPV